MEENDKPFGESRITFRLSSGRLVWVTNFSYGETYAGLLEGWPREELNQKIIERALADATAHMVPAAPVYMIQPIRVPVPAEVLTTFENSLAGLQKFYTRPPASTLLPIRCIAHLDSEPMHKDFSGSNLKVVWFQQPFFDKPLAVALTDSLREVPWEQNAHDFHH